VARASDTTIQQALSWGTATLTSALPENDASALDARVLLASALQRTVTYLYTWPDKAIGSTELHRYQRHIAQRGQGKPVAYITGQRDFWSLSLQVSPATLIPRPDTETLVEQALLRLPTGPATICDLGTGTGAVALAIASERPDCQILAIDVVAEAVELASSNAQANNLTNVTVLQSSWFANIQGQQFDMLVSNPPYVENLSPYLKQGDVRFEPASALTAGSDGLDDIRYIVQHAGNYLTAQGWLLLEHGYTQGPAVRTLLQEAGFIHVSTVNDLSGQPRISGGQWCAKGQVVCRSQ